MQWIRRFWLRLQTLLLRRESSQRLDDEVRFHLDQQIAENIAAGMDAREARYAAMRIFGNITFLKEEARATWGWTWLEQIAGDVRYGVRMLRRSPGFTSVAVITLALGIGANTAIFSLINALMLRTLPIQEPERVVALRWRAAQNPDTRQSYYWGSCPGEESGATACSFSYLSYEQLRRNREVFSGVFGFVPPSGITEITVNGQTSQGRGDFISGDFFSTLGVTAAAGRVLDPLDDVSGAPPAVVISYNYWRSRFGGDPSAVGKTIFLNGVPFTISGVAAPGFEGLETGVPKQFWVTLASRFAIDNRFPRERETDPKSVWIQMMGRLKPGIAVSGAEAALSATFAAISTRGPDALFKPDNQPRIELPSASRGFASMRQEFSTPLFVLMAAVGLILLVACANVAGLLLARAVAREREIAVRFALGAGRWRIVRALLTESVLLAFAGGALGIFVSYWGATSLSRFLESSGGGAWHFNVRPDLHVLAFTVGISCLVGILSGLAPGLRGTGLDLIPALKYSGNKGKSSIGQRFGLGAALVVTQTAVSILVLAGAGLLVRTLINLRNTETGFDARNILLFDIDARLSGYKDAKLAQLYREIQRRLSAAPGVTSASYSSTTLLSGSDMTTTFRVTEAPVKSGVNVDELPVGPDFFATMRIPTLIGRTFLAADFENAAKPQAMVVNQSFARQFFGKGNALGRLISKGDTKTPDYEIVGVVGDTKYDDLRKEMKPTAYFPMRLKSGSFEVRTAMDPRALIPDVREILSGFDSNLVMLSAKTQIEQIDEGLYQERLLATLSSLFGVLALALACVGLYGLLSYEVSRRKHEIGVRMALGAEQNGVMRLVIRRGTGLALFGTAIGVAAALGVTRYVETLLYGVKPFDPLTFVCIAALLLAVAAVACYIPARRAARVDPLVALRYE